MVNYVALPYQIYQLTRSNFAVGAMPCLLMWEGVSCRWSGTRG